MPQKRFKPLAFFTESARAKNLWRFVVRTAYKSAPVHRREILGWARSEFEMHRHEEDPDRIRYYVAEGTRRTKELETMLGISR